MYVQRRIYKQKQAAALIMQTILRAYMARQKYQRVRPHTQARCALPQLSLILTHLDLGDLALNLNLNHYFYSLTIER